MIHELVSSQFEEHFIKKPKELLLRYDLLPGLVRHLPHQVRIYHLLRRVLLEGLDQDLLLKFVFTEKLAESCACKRGEVLHSISIVCEEASLLF